MDEIQTVIGYSTLNIYIDKYSEYDKCIENQFFIVFMRVTLMHNMYALKSRETFVDLNRKN
ncbi:hypothetical protein CLV59_110202 [Chitinophaga dinghuensis]|uniref:Uncharacterized protein n=1 Tax=Chitinophaga dinghuensis TaxID=1539050 RepID=A0A327VMV5_9BACT|nr:hypothetical protein CLV59_110202 [Chitinophaga dinghuensis]